MSINPKIFRAYDIRGLYKKDLEEKAFYDLAQIFIAYLKSEQKFPSYKKSGEILVARDIRLSSPSLAKAFIKGAIDAGINVLDAGTATTPMFYHGVGKLGVSGGAMITASHNPKEYNGIKPVKRGGLAVSGKELYQFFRSKHKTPIVKSKGSCKKIDIEKDYLASVGQNFNIKRKIKLVVDASGGTTALFLPKLLKKMNLNYTPLFFQPDGSFSRHNPNPDLKESQRFAKRAILEGKADFGVVFDGDGDRMVVLDEN
jgi:phosphomannomutase